MTVKPKFECPYCKKMHTERTLISHKCALRDRYFQKDTKEFMIGFYAWDKFRTINGMWKSNTTDKVDRFINSSEYNMFYQLGVHLTTVHIIDVDNFIMYLLKNAIPAFKWKSDLIFRDWVINYTRTENMMSAIERSIHSIQNWADELSYSWQDFFKYVSSTRALLMIETGQISPWFLYAASTTDEMYNKLSDGEFEHLYQFINPSIWGIKKMKQKEEFTAVVNILKEFGI